MLCESLTMLTVVSRKFFSAHHAARAASTIRTISGDNCSGAALSEAADKIAVYRVKSSFSSLF